MRVVPKTVIICDGTGLSEKGTGSRLQSVPCDYLFIYFYSHSIVAGGFELMS